MSLEQTRHWKAHRGLLLPLAASLYLARIQLLNNRTENVRPASASFSLLVKVCVISLQPLELCSLPQWDFTPVHLGLETFIKTW